MTSIKERGRNVDIKNQWKLRQQEFVVDTEATVTLVSENSYTKLSMSVRPRLREVTQKN